LATVTLERLTKRYDGGEPAVRDLDLAIADGEFVVLLGPSGCGKSTALRMIAGLEPITSGRVSIDGRVVNAVPAKDRDIAMVFQSYALYPHMTVFENIAFGLRRRRVPRAEVERRVRAVTEKLGLAPFLSRKPQALSGGQRQRVALGRAIVREPKVFLFDEPLSNLDAKLRVAMRTEIKALHQRLKTTSVYVTHDQIEAMTMADKIVVMNEGRVEQIGSPLDLYDNPSNLFVAGFIGSPAMNFLSGCVAADGDGLAVEVGAGTCLPIGRRADVEPGREVVVGVRPEHFALAADGTPAEVVVVEPTGADTQIFCKLGGRDVTAVVRERYAFEPSTLVRLKPQLTFLFDPRSGNRLR
jgi:multiple sugar transport system ATP-binding protein